MDIVRVKFHVDLHYFGISSIVYKYFVYRILGSTLFTTCSFIQTPLIYDGACPQLFAWFEWLQKQ